jgi:hypothetical protein
MNVEIGAEEALFPEKEHISEIFVAVYVMLLMRPKSKSTVTLTGYKSVS